jgi:hypothetical protein
VAHPQAVCVVSTILDSWHLIGGDVPLFLGMNIPGKENAPFLGYRAGLLLILVLVCVVDYRACVNGG